MLSAFWVAKATNTAAIFDLSPIASSFCDVRLLRFSSSSSSSFSLSSEVKRPSTSGIQFRCDSLLGGVSEKMGIWACSSLRSLLSSPSSLSLPFFQLRRTRAPRAPFAGEKAAGLKILLRDASCSQLQRLSFFSSPEMLIPSEVSETNFGGGIGPAYRRKKRLICHGSCSPPLLLV